VDCSDAQYSHAKVNCEARGVDTDCVILFWFVLFDMGR
jgi:hypothetical protein